MFQLSYSTEFTQFREEIFCPQRRLSSRVCARVWLFRCSFVFESSTRVERARQPWDLRHLLESERYFSFVSFQLRLMATWHFSFKRRKCFTLWAITRKIELSAFLSLDAKLCWHFEALFFAGENSVFLLLELQNRKTNIRIWMLAPLSWANILWPILFFGKILQNKICPENLKCLT